jgi:hypothetical protein
VVSSVTEAWGLLTSHLTRVLVAQGQLQSALACDRVGFQSANNAATVVRATG